MFNLDKFENRKLIKQLVKYDVIRYNNEYVDDAYYIVFDTQTDTVSNTILLSLWRFDGGYDHAFINIIETDFSLNNQVEILTPKKLIVEIKSIQNYRKKDSGMSDKEEFFYNVEPFKVSKKLTSSFETPHLATIDVEGSLSNLILTAWTPLQQIPVERIRIGSKVEIWQINEILTLMKVIKL